jgi:tRNA (cmo5U34)-methyltransferase
VLVLGAGGGLELKAFAQMQPGWRFDGVDPSRPMLEQARATLGELASRVSFYDGYIDDAPMGPFDGAACLLTLHFLSREERVRTLKQIRARLRSGAPLVTAHHSFPNNDAAMNKWLSRFAAFVASSGPLPAGFDTQTMKQRMPFLSPEQDLSALEDAGFADIELFYAAFTFKGWIAYNTAL